MLDKHSNVGIKCTYCDNDALPETDPPVCEECRKLNKKASVKPVTLKELEAMSTIKDNNA